MRFKEGVRIREKPIVCKRGEPLAVRVLLVEDDEILAEVVEEALSDRHYMVDVAKDGQTGIELAEAFTYDLILLDSVLPKVNGIDFCQQRRLLGDRTPILLMTAIDSSTNKVAGLDAGADDYLVKPFDLQELLARMRALLRRGRDFLPPAIEWGYLRLNPSNCQVTYNNQRLHLTGKEYSILELFLRNPQRIFSQSALLDRLWSFEEPPSENTVRTHIKSLRQKLRKAGAEADTIETIYGLGYRLKLITPVGKVAIAELKKEAIAPATDNSTASNFFADVPVNLGKLPVKNKLPANNYNAPVLSPHETKAREHLAIAPLRQPSKKTAPKDKDGSLERSKIMEIWQRHKQKYLDRIAILNETVAAIENGTLDIDRRKQAQQQVHTLIGTLGSFGFEAASEKCREIEKILASGDRFSPQSEKVSRERIGQTASEISLEQNVYRLSQLIEELRLDLIGDESEVVVFDSQERLPEAAVEAKRQKSDRRLETGVNLAEKRSRESLQQPKLKQLLIVDDDAPLAEMLGAEATAWGMRAQIAIDLNQAREAIARRRPDVVLLDLCFPDSAENGLELLAELKNTNPPVPVVIFSAIESLAERVQVARLGGQGFLHKPISPVRVMGAIAKALEKSSLPAAKLLIVNDDPQLLCHLQSELEPWGFQLTLLNNPQQFWELLEKFVPDLLILDIDFPRDTSIFSPGEKSTEKVNMPKISGIDLCAVVRNDPRWHELPVLCLSERADAQTIHQVFSAGADDYIQKPFVGPELVARVLNRIDRSQMRRKLLTAKNQLF